MMVAPIIFLPIVLLVLAITSIVIYYFVYKNNINTAIHNGSVPKYRMMSPLKFTTIVIIGIFVIFGATFYIATLRAYNNSNNELDDKCYDGDYEFNVYEDKNIPSYLSVYNMNSNPGYNKKEEIKGDLKYTYFISTESYDNFHPSLIMFIQYTGKEKVVNFGYNGKFLTPDESPQTICGFGASGGEFDNYIMVVCNRSVNSIFSFELSLYKDFVKYDNLVDGAIAHETIDLFWENY